MGLGTGRRGMKSPPLLIAVLLACVFVLGINYWITSSRCVELQNRVVELEGRMRRAAAERGAVELKKNEYEDMLAKQKQQIDTIQSLHSSQMQNVHSQCDAEKESLLNNVTNKDHLMQNLQVQNSNLNKRLEESKLEFKELQESQTKKLSFELTQCSSKIAEVKEQFEERLRKAGVKEVNEDMETAVIETENLKQPTTIQEINQHKAGEKEEEKSQNKRELTTPNKSDKKEPSLTPEKKEPTLLKNHKGQPSQKQWSEYDNMMRSDSGDQPSFQTPSNRPLCSNTEQEETNNLELNVEVKKPSASPQKSKQEDENKYDLQEPANEINPDNVNAAEDEDEPKVEDAEDTEPNKENEEVEREHLINIDGQQDDDKGPKQNGKADAENPNYYNGDEENVAESEAEKQAQLTDNNQNIKDHKFQNGLNAKAADPEAVDGDNPPLK